MSDPEPSGKRKKQKPSRWSEETWPIGMLPSGQLNIVDENVDEEQADADKDKEQEGS